MKLTRRRCLLALGSGISAAAKPSLPEEWRRIAAATDGVVGAAALHLTSGQLVSLNGDEARLIEILKATTTFPPV